MRWLTRLGALAALAVGVATAWGLGWRGVVLLLAFFISGSLLSEGGGQRGARQVVANGGVAALAALAGNWPAFAGALAAATADTWASEIGRRSPVPPRLIITWRPVPAGTDGGITLLGTAAAIAGAGCIAVIAYLLGLRAAFPAVLTAGVAGMFVDSLLGASVQGAFRWLDNDAVNLATTVCGAVLCVGMSWLCCS